MRVGDRRPVLTILQGRPIANRMKRLHVTQDSNGFWLLSLENEDGSLKLLAHESASRDLLLHEAKTLVARGRFRGAEIVADPPAPTPTAGLDRPTHDPPPKPKRARGS